MDARKWLVLASSLLAIAPVARAGDDVHGPESLSEGNTAAANPTDNSAVTVDSALLGLAKRYDAELHGTYGEHGAWDAGGSIVDSRDAPVALGVSFRHLEDDPPFSLDQLPGWVAAGDKLSNKHRYNDIGAGLAVPVLGHRLSFGGGGSFSFTDQDGRGRGYTGNADASIATSPFPWLTIGVVGRNLLPIGGEYPLAFLGGIRFNGDGFGALAVDGGWQPGATKPLTVRVGLEKDIKGSARLRLGYENDGPDHRTGVTWGLGFVNTSGAVEYSMEIPFEYHFSIGSLIQQIGFRIRT